MAPQEVALPAQIRNEKDLQAYDRLFANVSYWKKVGEEYQNPLIVTGTILFNPHAASGIVLQNQEVIDAFGRRRVQPVRTYMERKGFILIPRFIFIDGRTGTRLYSEGHREQVLYPAQQNTPALSSLLRADGPAGSHVPQHAEHPEDPRQPRLVEVAGCLAICAGSGIEGLESGRFTAHSVVFSMFRLVSAGRSYSVTSAGPQVNLRHPWEIEPCSQSFSRAVASSK